ncbi:saxitoxin and tetrodotoxin-binding protein 1-like [Chelmon rostratus]|uniref:saxitoxin and tetrodotoxin-binding protein 1-like n=1 Tax=Chelmon rostratus TaxID=109905 RepID=UPI001BE7B20E|nr:saxitoxin and tetrodotoxin-binding protein 1-like [Chelmon rostratus]
MSVLKRAALLLLLLAAIGTNADSDHNDCDILNRTLATKDLHKISGDWVLVWSVTHNASDEDLLVNLTSSKVELRIDSDNTTITYNETNMHHGKDCTHYFMRISIPSDPSDSEHHTLRTADEQKLKDGSVTHYNKSSEVDLFETCSDCLTVVYKGAHAKYLLSYKRHGHHKDVELLKSAHDDHQKLAKCLGFDHDAPFNYDGVAEFCPDAKASAE